MGIEAVGHGRPFAFHEVEHLVGVEGLRDDVAGAGDHRQERAFGISERVEQRQVVQDHVVFGDA